MVDLFTGAENGVTRDNLLLPDESIVIVDDATDNILILKTFLSNRGFKVQSARNSAEFFRILKNHQVALVLLDIHLPDRDGTNILADLVREYPDLGVIMVTGITDVKIALECLRNGADDYLMKPVSSEQFYHTIIQTLKKRRLAIENRQFQQQLQIKNNRTRFLHHLSLKMNSAYLGALELNQVLQTILFGITSQEGLQFNRAFLALFDENQHLLQGKLAIGPGNREEAEQIWNDISRNKISLDDLFEQHRLDSSSDDIVVNAIARSLSVDAGNEQHPFIYACKHRTSILVEEGTSSIRIPEELIGLLQEDSFIITPLFSPRRPLGVIIADNFVTRKPITADDIEALEIFAGQASLAIEHSKLYTDMHNKISDLELVTSELERSRDLLVEAERYSALGHMSAQLVHAIRNPITSIGGTARLLAGRLTDESTKKFLDLLIGEAKKVELTLSDLFTFVSKGAPHKQRLHLSGLIKKSIMVFAATMKEQHITYHLELERLEPEIPLDEDKIQLVFLHLFKNAIEAMDEGGHVQIHLSHNSKWVRVEISDTGTGITSDDLNRLTDPFFTTKMYGTGLGLTLVEQVVKQHDGTLTVQRNEPNGLTISLLLPTHPDQ